MAFLGFFNVYSLRVNLSVGIVAMTEKRPIEFANGTIGYVSCCVYLYCNEYVVFIYFCFSTVPGTGTRFPVGQQGTWTHIEFILLGLHHHTISGRIIWTENRREFGDYFFASIFCSFEMVFARFT